MNFAGVKKIVIPEGIVKKIAYNGVVLWKGFTNLISQATFDNDLFSIVEANTKGYADGYRWSLSGEKVSVYNKGINVGRITGLIPYKAGKWRVKNIIYSTEVQNTGAANYSGHHGYTVYIKKDGTVKGINSEYHSGVSLDYEKSLLTFNLSENNNIEYLFFSGFKHNEPPIVTVDEEII